MCTSDPTPLHTIINVYDAPPARCSLKLETRDYNGPAHTLHKALSTNRGGWRGTVPSAEIDKRSRKGAAALTLFNIWAANAICRSDPASGSASTHHEYADVQQGAKSGL